MSNEPVIIWGLDMRVLATQVTPQGRRVAAKLQRSGRMKAAAYAPLRSAGYVWAVDASLTEDEARCIVDTCKGKPT